jgi:ATP-dependent protease HslVU (ClpYQ) peptidase subunit
LDVVVGEHGVDAIGHGGERASSKAEAVTRVALSTSWTKANLLVRSMATKR